jgi:hypothetical protein
LGKVQKLKWHFSQAAYELRYPKFAQVTIFVDGNAIFIGFGLIDWDRQMADGAEWN